MLDNGEHVIERQPLHIFAFSPQRLAARCQDVDVCRTPENGHGEGGGSSRCRAAFHRTILAPPTAPYVMAMTRRLRRERDFREEPANIFQFPE